MRLFLAARLAADQLRELGQAQALLRRASDKISLTKAENLHLTLHFLGETAAADTERLLSSLREFELPPAGSLTSRLDGYGFFRRRDGDLIYADLAVSAELVQLQKDLGGVLAELGFEPDRRRWKAHVSLARRTQLALSWPEVHQKLPVQAETYALSDLVLFKSEFTGNGMLYTPLFVF